MNCFYGQTRTFTLCHCNMGGAPDTHWCSTCSAGINNNKCEEKDMREGWGTWESGWTKEKIVINGPETKPRGQTPNQFPHLPTSSLGTYSLSPCSWVTRARWRSSAVFVCVGECFKVPPNFVVSHRRMFRMNIVDIIETTNKYWEKSAELRAQHRKLWSPLFSKL